MKQKGFVPVLIILLITTFLTIGYFLYKNNTMALQPIQTITNLSEGHYELCYNNKTACNYIDLTSTPDGKMNISGRAYWQSSTTVNTGEINGTI